MSDRDHDKEFTSLVNPLMSDLLTMAHYWTRNIDDAEDLRQQTLMAAFRFFEKYERGTNFKNWIRAIMRNQFLTKERREGSGKTIIPRKKMLSLDNDERETLAHHYSMMLPDNGYEELFGDAVSEALLSLSEEHREIIILADIHEYLHFEISQMLGIASGTVKSRLFRARQELVIKLEQYGKANGFTIGDRKLGTKKLWRKNRQTPPKNK